jgi:hypothetical protein
MPKPHSFPPSPKPSPMQGEGFNLPPLPCLAPLLLRWEKGLGEEGGKTGKTAFELKLTAMAITAQKQFSESNLAGSSEHLRHDLWNSKNNYPAQS